MPDYIDDTDDGDDAEFIRGLLSGITKDDDE